MCGRRPKKEQFLSGGRHMRADFAKEKPVDMICMICLFSESKKGIILILLVVAIIAASLK